MARQSRRVPDIQSRFIWLSSCHVLFSTHYNSRFFCIENYFPYHNHRRSPAHVAHVAAMQMQVLQQQQQQQHQQHPFVEGNRHFDKSCRRGWRALVYKLETDLEWVVVVTRDSTSMWAFLSVIDSRMFLRCSRHGSCASLLDGECHFFSLSCEVVIMKILYHTIPSSCKFFIMQVPHQSSCMFFIFFFTHET